MGRGSNMIVSNSKTALLKAPHQITRDEELPANDKKSQDVWRGINEDENEDQSEASLFDKVAKILSALMIMFDLYGDISLLWKVYWPARPEGDNFSHYYFGCSAGSLSFVVLDYWIMGINRAGNIKCTTSISSYIGWISLKLPFFSVIAVSMYDPMAGSWRLACGSFPQYITNISYDLEYSGLGGWQKISLSGSLLSLMLGPIHVLAMSDIASANTNFNVSVLDGPSFNADSKSYLKWVRCRFIVLGPAILVEVMHFLPVLIEHFSYKKLAHKGFLGFLVMFNAPKLLFLLQRNNGCVFPNMVPGTEIA